MLPPSYNRFPLFFNLLQADKSKDCKIFRKEIVGVQAEIFQKKDWKISEKNHEKSHAGKVELVRIQRNNCYKFRGDE